MKQDRFLYLFAGTAFAILFILLSFLGDIFFSNRFYDVMMRQNQTVKENLPLVIINIDDSSIRALKAQWPWDRKYLSKALENILKQKPKVIGLDLLLTEKSNEKSDLLLKKTIENTSIPIVLAMNFFSEKSRDLIDSKNITMSQIGVDLPIFGKDFGFVNLIQDSDGTIRKIKLKQKFMDKNYDSFSKLLSEKYLDKKINWTDEEIFIHFSDSSGLYQKISFFQVFENQIPENILKDKIVLIGPGFASSRDFHSTPIHGISEDKSLLPGVEIFAHTVYTLILKNNYQEISIWLVSLILLFTYGLLVLCFYFGVRLWIILCIALGITCAYLFVSIMGFYYFQIIFPVLISFTYWILFLILFMIRQALSIYQKNRIIDEFKEIQQDKKNHLFKKYNLSEREQEIVALLIDGYKNPQIAKKLFISLNTVKFHVKNIYEKMHISSRVRLIKLLNP